MYNIHKKIQKIYDRNNMTQEKISEISDVRRAIQLEMSTHASRLIKMVDELREKMKKCDHTFSDGTSSLNNVSHCQICRKISK